MWEYKTVEIMPEKSFWGGKFNAAAIENELNAYGEQGWELVGLSNPAMGYGETRALIAVFKRKKEN